MNEAEPDGIVVSNSFYQRVSFEDENSFEELPSVEAKNVGCIKCWKYVPDGEAAPGRIPIATHSSMSAKGLFR